MICDYPVNDLNELGLQSMLLSRSRRKWIMSKFIWTALMVCIFYALTFGILLLESIIQNNFSEEIISLSMKAFLMGDKWFIPYILPMLSDIAIAVLQMTLSFLTNPFLAYIFSIIYLIISVYVKNAFLLGNYSMLLRNIHLADNGLHTEMGVVSCSFVIIISICISIFLIKKRDIIGKYLEV